MYSKLYTTTLSGINGRIIEAETNISNGIPSFKIVGMSDRIIREATDRVTAAMRNSGIDFPARKIRINLAPSELPKTGTGIDLAIALGIYVAANQINNKKIYCFGELGLNGEIKQASGMFQFLEEISKLKSKEHIVIIPRVDSFPYEFDIKNLYCVENIRQAIYAIRGKVEKSEIKTVSNLGSNILSPNIDDIVGLEHAKRLLLLSASGSHHILLSGSFGVGKTHIAKCLVSLLPPLNQNDIYEIARVQSATNGISTISRPFREVSRGITQGGLLGGGLPVRPGEITLAHKGVLFIDELAEHSISLLNNLREPMENGHINLSNQGSKIQLPCDFLLVGATNLCPCGKEECTCTVWERNRYVKHIPPAILNRIDLYAYIERTNLFSSKSVPHFSEYRKTVEKVRRVQSARYFKEIYKENSKVPLTAFEKYCPLSFKAKSELNNAIEKLRLNGRDYVKTVRVARTIADIENRDLINENDILEALSYRTNALRTVASF